MNHFEPYVMQTLGFFLQIFPASMLAYVPFEEKSYRKGRWHTILTTALMMIGVTVLFPVLASMLDEKSAWDINSYTNLYMFILALLFMGFFFYEINEPFIKKMLVFVHSIFLVVEMFLIRAILQPWYPTLFTGGFTGRDILVLVPIMATTSLICYVINRWIMRKYLRGFDSETMRNESIVLILMVYFYFGMLVFYILRLHSTKGGLTAGGFSRLAPIFLINGVILLMYFTLLLRDSAVRREQYEIRRIHDTETLQYQKIEREMETARRQEHDLMHQLNLLYQLANQGDTKTIKAEVEKIARTYRLVAEQKFCNNQVLNNLLRYYFQWAKDDGISCEVMADVPSLSIDDNDLTILFGNLMENAILANETVEGQEWIRVKAEVIGNRLAILIENACSEVSTTRTYDSKKMYQSYAAFQSVRFRKGTGLSIVENIVDRYEGSAQYRYDAENHTFTSRILLNTQAPQSSAAIEEAPRKCYKGISLHQKGGRND